jgi:pyridinium-3,5-biscarboxylic acid mononucleotide synthase
VTSREAILLLEKFRAGQVGRDDVLRAFQAAPTADLGFAHVDLQRALRKNFPEVIFGSGKTPPQVASIAMRLAKAEKRLLVTRIGKEHAQMLRRKLRPIKYHDLARCLTYEKARLPKRRGVIAIVAAGTSDRHGRCVAECDRRAGQ